MPPDCRTNIRDARQHRQNPVSAKSDGAIGFVTSHSFDDGKSIYIDEIVELASSETRRAFLSNFAQSISRPRK